MILNTMEEQEQVTPSEIIRETTRNLLQLHRRSVRHEEADDRRLIDKSITTAFDVEAVANKLKTKSSVTAAELQGLKNALIEDEKNIKIILSVHGALRGLVRELSNSNNAKKQTAAAGCVCNLALGDSKATVTLAKAAGPYLITCLDSLYVELAVTCAWTLGNLSGGGVNTCSILMSQGALSKLLSVKGDNIENAAVYALTHLVYQMKDELSSDVMEKIALSISKQKPISLPASQLLFIISCHRDFPTIQFPPDTCQILDNFSESIQNHLSSCKGNGTCCELIYLTRTVANMTSDCDQILGHIRACSLEGSLKKLLSTDNSVLRDSLLWLLGNLANLGFDKDVEKILMAETHL